MLSHQSPREPAIALERLQRRIDIVAVAIADAALQRKLGILREQSSTAEMLLRQPSAASLGRAADHVQGVTLEMDALVRPQARKPHR